MKKTHLIGLTGLFLLGIILLINSCSKQEKNESPQKNINPTQLGKTAGNCSCVSNPGNCPDCVKDLMKGSEKKVYTISWQSCEDACDVNGTSTVTFCYADAYDCKKMAMQIDNPPACLPCIPNPYCVIGTVDCQQGNTASFSYDDPNDGTHYAVTFVGDPKLTISCEGADKVFHTCTGDAVEQ